jgi:hypothetical protein
LKTRKRDPSCVCNFFSKAARLEIAFNASPKPNGRRFRELFMDEAAVLVPATAAV